MTRLRSPAQRASFGAGAASRPHHRITGARAFQASAAALALIFLAFHLAYLPRSLEDLDSINFALGMRHFDVAEHQPHPPGYPVFIAIARAARAIVPDEAKALALVSAASGALGVIAIARLFGRLGGVAPDGVWTLAATAIATTSPLYWFTAVRPLSDMSGLAAAVGVQAMTLGAEGIRALLTPAFCAGFASGLRSQVAWLTVPLLVMQGFRLRRRGSSAQQILRLQAAVALAFAAGALVWLVPLIALTGGPLAYWRALSHQGAEDLGNISMLWTTHNARAAADALYYAFIAPWAAWIVAASVLVLAAIGAARLYRRQPDALAMLATAFGPYMAFDLLFQETFTGRYALPLVIPLAYVAVAGLRLLPRQAGLIAAVALAMFDAHVGGTSIAAYSRQKAPAFRLLDDMAASRATDRAPVLAMDRRNFFDFRRPIVWVGGALPRFAARLPAPPQHEWLEAVEYWNRGGRAPVWFVVDPKRASIDLLEHGQPTPYRWPLAYPALISGARPGEMDWYRVDRPEWYVGEGWSLTPEAAGIADGDKRGLAYGPIQAWISRRALGGAMMVGGRSFDHTRRPRLTVRVAGRAVVDRTLMPGAFLLMAPIPRDIEDPIDRRDYAAVVVDATPPAPVAVEQFDASGARTLLAFGDGWHEQEFNPRTGARWRWLSERGELKLAQPSTSPLTLHLEGESPRTYFSHGSRLTIRSGDLVLLDRVLSADFAVDLPIAGAADTLVLQTDQVYVPAERTRRTQDRRHLGLRIFRCELR